MAGFNEQKDDKKKDAPPQIDPNMTFMIEAVKTELGRTMQHEFDAIHERIDEVEEANARRFENHRGGGGGGRGVRGGRGGRGGERPFRARRDPQFDDFEDLDEDDRHLEDNNLGNIKMNIPSFQGKNDPEAYLEWERKVDLIFD